MLGWGEKHRLFEGNFQKSIAKIIAQTQQNK